MARRKSVGHFRSLPLVDPTPFENQRVVFLQMHRPPVIRKPNMAPYQCANRDRSTLTQAFNILGLDYL